MIMYKTIQLVVKYNINYYQVSIRGVRTVNVLIIVGTIRSIFSYHNEYNLRIVYGYLP